MGSGEAGIEWLRGDFMGALEESTAIHALALSLAKSLSREEATRLGLLLIQLGTTLDTIVALEELDEDGEAVDTGR